MLKHALRRESSSGALLSQLAEGASDANNPAGGLHSPFPRAVSLRTMGPTLEAPQRLSTSHAAAHGSSSDHILASLTIRTAALASLPPRAPSNAVHRASEASISSTPRTPATGRRPGPFAPPPGTMAPVWPPVAAAPSPFAPGFHRCSSSPEFRAGAALLADYLAACSSQAPPEAQEHEQDQVQDQEPPLAGLGVCVGALRELSLVAAGPAPGLMLQPKVDPARLAALLAEDPPPSSAAGSVAGASATGSSLRPPREPELLLSGHSPPREHDDAPGAGAADAAGCGGASFSHTAIATVTSCLLGTAGLGSTLGGSDYPAGTTAAGFSRPDPWELLLSGARGGATAATTAASGAAPCCSLTFTGYVTPSPRAGELPAPPPPAAAAAAAPTGAVVRLARNSSGARAPLTGDSCDGTTLSSATLLASRPATPLPPPALGCEAGEAAAPPRWLPSYVASTARAAIWPSADSRAQLLCGSSTLSSPATTTLPTFRDASSGDTGRAPRHSTADSDGSALPLAIASPFKGGAAATGARESPRKPPRSRRNSVTDASLSLHRQLLLLQPPPASPPSEPSLGPPPPPPHLVASLAQAGGSTPVFSQAHAFAVQPPASPPAPSASSLRLEDGVVPDPLLLLDGLSGLAYATSGAFAAVYRGKRGVGRA
jgi:hypothetical protein